MMETRKPTQEELVAAYEEIQKLEAIWPGMPFTGLAAFKRGMSQSEMLQTLREVLVEYCEEHHKLEKDLLELENDVRAFRRIVHGGR